MLLKDEDPPKMTLNSESLTHKMKLFVWLKWLEIVHYELDKTFDYELCKKVFKSALEICLPSLSVFATFSLWQI